MTHLREGAEGDDERRGMRQDEDRPRSKDHDAIGSVRQYVAPALVEYGTVAKLTQTGTGSVADFSGMMRMMVCL